MKSSYKTEYTEVEVHVNEANPEANYHGYIAVQFEVEGVGDFFSETMDLILLEAIRKGLKHTPNLMVDKEIYLQDFALLINLPSVSSKDIAVDVVRIVKQIEKDFNSRLG